MSIETVQKLKAPARPSVSDVLDQACLDEGMSVQKLEMNKRLADVFDRLLAPGRTVENINAEWDSKTQQDIVREYGNSASKRTGKSK